MDLKKTLTKLIIPGSSQPSKSITTKFVSAFVWWQLFTGRYQTGYMTVCDILAFGLGEICSSIAQLSRAQTSTLYTISIATSTQHSKTKILIKHLAPNYLFSVSPSPKCFAWNNQGAVEGLTKIHGMCSLNTSGKKWVIVIIKRPGPVWLGLHVRKRGRNPPIASNVKLQVIT